MSDITVTTGQRQAAVADPAANAKRVAKSTDQPTQDTGSTAAAQGDTVSIRASAQGAAASPSGAALSDEAASETSLNLRQQLGVNSLSVSARQNQSILSLLRG